MCIAMKTGIPTKRNAIVSVRILIGVNGFEISISEMQSENARKEEDV